MAIGSTPRPAPQDEDANRLAADKGGRRGHRGLSSSRSPRASVSRGIPAREGARRSTQAYGGHGSVPGVVAPKPPPNPVPRAALSASFARSSPSSSGHVDQNHRRPARPPI